MKSRLVSLVIAVFLIAGSLSLCLLKTSLLKQKRALYDFDSDQGSLHKRRIHRIPQFSKGNDCS